MSKKITSGIGIAAAIAAYLIVTTYPRWMPRHWREFSSPEGGFSVLMPGAPKASTERIADTQAEIHMFICDLGAYAYMSSYFDLDAVPVAPDTVLDHARDGSVRKMEGVLLGEQELNLGGHAGREFKAQAQDKFVDSRMYIVGRRFYMLTAAHPNRDDDDVPRFLSSFKLLPGR